MDFMDPIDPGVDVDLGYQDSDWGFPPPNSGHTNTEGGTVDGLEIQRSPVEVGSSSHYLQGFSTIPGGAGFLPSTVWPGMINEAWEYVPSGERSHIPFEGGKMMFHFHRWDMWSFPGGYPYESPTQRHKIQPTGFEISKLCSGEEVSWLTMNIGRLGPFRTCLKWIFAISININSPRHAKRAVLWHQWSAIWNVLRGNVRVDNGESLILNGWSSPVITSIYIVYTYSIYIYILYIYVLYSGYKKLNKWYNPITPRHHGQTKGETWTLYTMAAGKKHMP